MLHLDGELELAEALRSVGGSTTVPVNAARVDRHEPSSSYTPPRRHLTPRPTGPGSD
jgi:hypothetical protein